MKTLRFEISRGFLIPPIEEITVTEIELQEFKNKCNKFYETIIDDINKDGGYCEILIPNHGKSIQAGNIKNISVDTADKLHDLISRH